MTDDIIDTIAQAMHYSIRSSQAARILTALREAGWAVVKLPEPDEIDRETPNTYCRAQRGRLCVCGRAANHAAMHQCGSADCGIRWIEPYRMTDKAEEADQ